MDIYSTYSVKIKHYNRIFMKTVELYRDAVDYFIQVCLKEWDSLKDLSGPLRGNCFVRQGDYTAGIKVFIRNTWDWITVSLKKSDVDYILKYCYTAKECSPTLQRRGKEWFLDFPFQEEVTLRKKPVMEQTVLSVDLGINSACVCTALKPDGTVMGRTW